MSESSTKRPPHNPPAEPARTVAAAAAATEAAPAALAVPRVQAVFTARGNPAAMPDPRAFFDAFAHGAEAYADEMAGLLQTGLATATDTAKAMLGAKTLTEALEINAGFVRKSLDTMLTGSVRLTDITARMAEESLRPLMPAR
jgi:hypothetical protein